MCSIFGVTDKSIPVSTLRACFDRTISRGPDMSRFEEFPLGYLGFHRLAIMGLNEKGMQPFCMGGDRVVCNGELYGFRPLRARLMVKYPLKGESDCEILDAVGHSMVNDLKALAERTYTDEAFIRGAAKYDHCPPFTKESLLYRDLFEMYYPGQAKMIPDYWMPNKSWPGCDVDDPSARVLANYGDSGK